MSEQSNDLHQSIPAGPVGRVNFAPEAPPGGAPGNDVIAAREEPLLARLALGAVMIGLMGGGLLIILVGAFKVVP